MKRTVLQGMFGLMLLAVSPAAWAQDCSNISTADLRGTYSMAGSGWGDVSKLLAGIPGLPPLPTGLVPMSWIGAYTWNGTGGGTGWVTLNVAGNQMSTSFVGLKYSVNADCSIQATFSMKVSELGGIVVGPVTRLLVPMVNQGGSLELRMMLGGTAPGTPGGVGVDLGTAYRLSMKY